MSTVAVETNLSAFNLMLGRYMAFTSKTPDEVLEHKGRDLGIKFFQGFRQHRWKGPRSGRGVAWRELRARSRAGKGIRLRSSIQPSDKAPDTHMSYRKLRGTGGSLRKLLVPVKTSEHQKKVFAELGLRQGGVGVLAASFLWFRRRSSQARGTYYVRNKTGRPLGYVERTNDAFRIVSDTAGLAEIGERYGIVSGALGEAREDMIKYLKERHAEGYQRAFGEAPR